MLTYIFIKTILLLFSETFCLGTNIAFIVLEFNFLGGNMLRKGIILVTFLLSTVLYTFAHAGYSLDASGSSGYSGSRGSTGQDGTRGQFGDDAGHMDLLFNAQGDTVNITGTLSGRQVSRSYNLFGETIYLGADGGNGGNGGDGGPGFDGMHGRDGSRGVNGRRGRRGRDGANGTKSHPNGKPGGDGGNGTNGTSGHHGTSGGHGGNGGDGGNAGYGGDAGNIVVRYLDSSLLIHIRSSISGGFAGTPGNAGRRGHGGRGGNGGRGGIGGKGGPGGKGGSGYVCSEAEKTNGCRNGHAGRNGSSGRKGQNGSHGRSGTRGSDGFSGASGESAYGGLDGNIRFLQVDASGQVINEHKGKNIYNVKVSSFSVIDENNDGIFEPGEKFIVSNIRLNNVGAMNAPAGTLINFRNVEGSLLAPAISVGQSVVLPGQLYGTVQNLSVGESYSLQSNASLRGISFRASHQNFRLIVQYPIVHSGVQIPEWVPYGTTKKAYVKLRNISTKPYSNVKINYALAGGLIYSVANPLGSIPAGGEASEVLEFHYEDSSPAYEVSTLTATIYRGTLRYADTQFKSQVGPSYIHNTNSEVLVVSNGYDFQTYINLKSALKDLNFKFDIYDARLNGNLSSQTIDSYKGKLIFFANSPKNSPINLTAFHHFAKNGGVATLGSVGKIKSQHYMQRVYQNGESLFNKEGSAQIDLVKFSLLDALSTSLKRELLETYILTNNASSLKILREAFIREIKEEYILATEDSDIYNNQENPLIVQYNTFAMNLDVVKDIELRILILGMVEDLLNVPGGRRIKYKKRFKLARDAAEEIAGLAESCGILEGKYMGPEGDSMSMWTTGFRKAKANWNGISFKSKEKALDGDMAWSLRYKFGGTKYMAEFSMACEGARISMQAVFPHDNSTRSFVKYTTKK